ncbi:MAG TPA: hypothetical protein VMS17_15510 [Gemmataceae bacterium]|nr:hypothetical protein [Gemmataceae bacterium]
MSRLATPVIGKTLWATGDVRLSVDLELRLKDRAGVWKRTAFRVDTAADVTTFPAYQAKQLLLPIPSQASRGAIHRQTGLEIRSGLLRFRMVGMDATEYAVPCFFLGDPNRLPTGVAVTKPRALLRPLALLDQVQFDFHKNATITAPYGEMIIEKK